MSSNVQLGSLKFPESPATSIPETFSLLRQATSVYDQSIATLNITTQFYASSGFLIGVPLSTVPGGVAFHGLNTRARDLMNIRTKNMATDNTIHTPGRCYVTLSCEQLVEIREGSVSVLD